MLTWLISKVQAYHAFINTISVIIKDAFVYEAFPRLFIIIKGFFIYFHAIKMHEMCHDKVMMGSTMLWCQLQII